MDIVSTKKRSEMMAAVRTRDTKPELTIRGKLHRRGLRYRLHVKDLPGKPDLVLPKYRTVIFVNGCFWHQHQGCAKASIPTTRTKWWRDKLRGNVQRDRKSINLLEEMGWSVITVWECEILKNADTVADFIFQELIKRLGSNYPRSSQ